MGRRNLDDHFDNCRGYMSGRMGSYPDMRCCCVLEDKYCSQRYKYEGDDNTLVKYGPYCKAGIETEGAHHGEAERS